MNEQLPLVSICIPTYNRAGMAGKAIDSALSQTYTNIEVIVVDNASQDNIESLIATYLDPRLKFYKNTKNLGLFGNFNRCIELARGKYIHILHSDDFIDPNFTQNCVEFLEEHPDVGMTFGSVRQVADEIESKTDQSFPPRIYDIPEGFKKVLEIRSFISCPTVVMRKEVYDTIGNYSMEYPYSGDFYQWLRVTQNYRIAAIPSAILYYRTGTHSESYRLLFKTPLGYIDTIKIFVRIIDELGDTHKRFQYELNLAYVRHLRDCLFAGIVRSGSMHYYSGLYFIGLALTTWSMIRPASLSERIGKLGKFILIASVALVILFPGGRYVTRKILRVDADEY